MVKSSDKIDLLQGDETDYYVVGEGSSQSGSINSDSDLEFPTGDETEYYIGKTLKRNQVLIFMSLSLLMATDAVGVLCVGCILSQYTEMNTLEKGLVTAGVFFGMAVGAPVGGAAAQKWGRTNALIVSMIIACIGAVLAPVAPTPMTLAAARAVAGAGVGATNPVVFTLGAELFPESYRATILNAIAAHYSVGIILTNLIAWYLFEIGPNKFGVTYSWRFFAAICAVPPIISLVCIILFLPGSPKYLLSRGRAHTAARILRHMSGLDVRAATLQSSAIIEEPEPTELQMEKGNPQQAPIDFFDTDGSDVISRCKSKITNIDFFQDVPKMLVPVMLVWWGLSFGSYGLLTWNSVVFANLGLSDPYLCSLILVCADLPGHALSIYLANKVGRQALLNWSLGLATFFSFMFSGAALLAAYDEGESAATMTVVAGFLFETCICAAWNILNGVSAEIFPIETRSLGMGIATSTGRVGAVAAQISCALLEASPSLMVLVMAINMLFSLLTCVACVKARETSTHEDASS